jgi:PAT family beta-lactamase induction signal transducer AmpG
MSIDTWRLEVADDTTPLDLLSAVYQFGYRIAAFVGGAGALLLADQLPWNTVFATAAFVMALSMLGTLAAPEPEVRAVPAESQSASSTPALRAYSVGAVLLAWGWAAIVLVWFMVAAINATTPPDAKAFTATYGPLIVIATVILPSALAAWIALRKQRNDLPLPVPLALAGLSSRLYGVIVEPFVELMGRLKWGAVLVLLVILSYRITDSIWGPFAYPFYLGELKYTNTEVAFASKMIGVAMLLIGIVLAAWVMVRFGRMFSMLLGAITAAATNLLYVDLAQGSPVISAFVNATGIGPFFESMGLSERLLWLITAIAGENIAAGFAGAVFVAYVSSLASKLHGAVQFAVFTSLTMLIGTLGRGALGEMIKTDGYASVFMFTMWIGGIAVVACALEWFRQTRGERPT